VKKSSDFIKSLFAGAVYFGADGLRSVFTYFSILFDMPFSVEAMPPKKTSV